MEDEAPDIDLLHLQLPDVDFIVCDVETTGLSPHNNRITEIALVRVREGEIVDRWSSLVNPRQFIPREITDLTGITNEMVYEAPDFGDVAPRIGEFLGGAVFVAHNASFDRGFVDASLERCGRPRMTAPVLCTARLARRLMPKSGSKSLRNLAHQLGIRNPASHRAGGDAQTTAHLLVHFLAMLEERFDIDELGDLVAFQYRSVSSVITPPKNILKIREQLAELPYSPGVYFFHDKRGDILYIGKAKELRERVQSYFYSNIGHTDKIRKMVRHVHSITWKTTETELSALLLESRSIKAHQPPFNSALKSIRKFPFIRIDNNDSFPRISWCYEIGEEGCEYYGPFSSRFTVETALESIGRLFHLRKCVAPLRPSPARTPCMYHAMHQCPAPCAALQTAEEYAREIDTVRGFLSGARDELIPMLTARMEEKAAAFEFEAAAELRDRIAVLTRLVRQQQAMMRSVHEQNLVVLTPARRQNVEVHFIRGGILVEQFLLHQSTYNRRTLRASLRKMFYTEQGELFGTSREEINDMRIIASWCMNKQSESVIIDAREAGELKELEQRIVQALESIGNGDVTGVRTDG